MLHFSNLYNFKSQPISYPMLKLSLLTISTALLFSSCASHDTASSPAAGVSPDPAALLKAMSSRLASAKQYRFTVSRTIPKRLAEELNEPTKANIKVEVARPDKVSATISQKETTRREMIFDGRTFTVVDGINHFYSQAPLRGSVDDAMAQLGRVYGFRPPLAEFVVSNPYRDLKSRMETVSYLGEGTVRQGGQVISCHRIGLRGELADAELWLGAEDSLPRRLKATRSNAGDPLVDLNFLTWDFDPQVSASDFRYQPPANAQKIPMVTVAQANASN